MEALAARLLGWLTKAEIAVVVLSFAAMTLLLLADVIGREVFARGIFGASAVALYFLILAAMLSFDLATGRDAHLRPTVFDALLPAAWETGLRRVGHVLGAAIALVVLVACWRFIAETRFFNETNPTIRVPLWPMQVPLALGFGLSALRHLLYAVLPGLAPVRAGVSE